MSPEVARYLPYNLSADIYSFGVLLWNIYSLEQPFEDMSRSAHSHLVVYGGQRPHIPKDWPTSLTELITSCWEEAPYKRPTMQQVVRGLEKELDSLDDSSHHSRHGSPRNARSGSFVLNRDAIAEQPMPSPPPPNNNNKKGFVDKVFQRLPSSVHRAIVA